MPSLGLIACFSSPQSFFYKQEILDQIKLFWILEKKLFMFESNPNSLKHKKSLSKQERRQLAPPCIVPHTQGQGTISNPFPNQFGWPTWLENSGDIWLSEPNKIWFRFGSIRIQFKPDSNQFQKGC